MFLDIALGLLVGDIIAHLSKLEPFWFAIFGAVFALLPDIDALIHFIKTREVAAHAKSPRDHRDGCHYPIPYLLIGTTLLMMFSSLAAILFFVSSTLHFLHDSLGTGWGVKWLYPFKKNNYKFFSDETGAWSLENKLMSWNPEELKHTIIRYGDPYWISNLIVGPLLQAVTFEEAPSEESTVLLIIEIVLPVLILCAL